MMPPVVAPLIIMVLTTLFLEHIAQLDGFVAVNFAFRRIALDLWRLAVF